MIVTAAYNQPESKKPFLLTQILSNSHLFCEVKGGIFVAKEVKAELVMK